MKRSLAMTVTLAILAIPVSAFAGARAELDGSLAAGEATRLDVTVDGDATQPPDLQIAGARVRLTGQTSETSIVNGATSHQTTFVYAITPAAAGSLEIPAITVASSAGTQTTAPVHATVSASAAPAAAATTGGSRVVQSSSHAFITLDLPSHTLVVGQAVPVTIRAYFRAGTSATLDGAPQLTTDAFTLSNLSDKPTQNQVEIRGEPYLQATWTALLSPVKPSTGKLAVELPVELAFRAAPRPSHHRTLRDLFGDDGDVFGDADPFGSMNIDVDSMFDIGPMQQQQVTLRGPTSTITVVEPPLADRPADYTGAVGAFSIAVDAPTGTPRVGEPLTLAFHVTGTGNFDRVAGVGVVDSPGLKTYPAKADFVASKDHGATTGTKTFTQTVVPVRAGSIDVPSVALSYFDPVKHLYVTAHTAAIPLVVAPAPGGGAADPGLSASVRDPGMLPNRVDPGDPHATLTPLIRRASLWLGFGGIVLATLLATLLAWSRGSRRIADVLASLRVDREVTHATDAMKRATIDNDQAAFFTAARRAFQVRLASTWHARADAITAHDVGARLGKGAHGDAIREVFEYADGMAYGAGVAEPLDYWNDIIRAELAHLEVSP